MLVNPTSMAIINEGTTGASIPTRTEAARLFDTIAEANAVGGRYPYIGEGSIYGGVLGTKASSSFTSQKVTANTSGYYTKVKQGSLLPMNPYQRTIEEIKFSRGLIEFRAGGNNRSRYFLNKDGMSLLPLYPLDHEGIYLTIPASELNAVDAVASTKTRLKIGDQKAGLGETILQANRTLDMFGTNVLRIVTAYRAIRSGRPKDAWNALYLSARRRQGLRFQKSYAVSREKAVGQLWLELQYGWLPLVRDIYGVTEALHARLKQQGVYERATASNTRKFSDSWNPGGFAATTVTSATSYGVKYIVYYRIIDQETRTLQQLGIINPVAVAWDLVPFSFLVDWLLPIGNWLSSMTSTAGLEFVAGCKMTKKVETTTRVDWVQKLNKPDLESTYTADRRGSKSRRTFTRSTLTDWPSVSLPRFKNPFSRTHMLNGLALLSTFKRK